MRDVIVGRVEVRANADAASRPVVDDDVPFDQRFDDPIGARQIDTDPAGSGFGIERRIHR